MVSSSDQRVRCENFPEFSLGDVYVSPRSHKVSLGNKSVRLEAKIVNVLCILKQHAGDVVTRSEFIDYLWDGRPGSDECLTRAISVLRAAFRKLNPEFRPIETISKSGYRLRRAAMEFDAD